MCFKIEKNDPFQGNKGTENDLQIVRPVLYIISKRS